MKTIHEATMQDNQKPSKEERPNEERPEDELPEEVTTLLIAGKKIDAIKLIRKQSGLGLKEAKDLVENYMLKHPERFPDARTSSLGSNTLIFGLVVLAALLTYQFVSQNL